MVLHENEPVDLPSVVSIAAHREYFGVLGDTIDDLGKTVLPVNVAATFLFFWHTSLFTLVQLRHNGDSRLQ